MAIHTQLQHIIGNMERVSARAIVVPERLLVRPAIAIASDSTSKRTTERRLICLRGISPRTGDAKGLWNILKHQARASSVTVTTTMSIQPPKMMMAVSPLMQPTPRSISVFLAHVFDVG